MVSDEEHSKLVSSFAGRPTVRVISARKTRLVEEFLARRGLTVEGEKDRVAVLGEDAAQIVFESQFDPDDVWAAVLSNIELLEMLETNLHADTLWPEDRCTLMP